MSTQTKEEEAVSKYRYSRAMTAGRIQSIILLLEKAKLLISNVDAEHPEQAQLSILKARNIIAQLEMALDFRRGLAAPEIFGLYEQVYTCLDNPSPKSLEIAGFLLEHFRDTIKIKFRT